MEVLRKIPKTLVIISILALVTGYVIFRIYFPAPGIQLPGKALSDGEAKTLSLSDNSTYSAALFYYEVSGQVNKPGVYQSDQPLILQQAIEKAGGYTLDADMQYVYKFVSLSAKVKPEQKIYIPSSKETQDPVGGTSQNAKFNLNTVSLNSLETIPGVGPVTAEKIVAARPFQSCDQVNKLKGISSATKENIVAMCQL
jgi:competence protein ComEA